MTTPKQRRALQVQNVLVSCGLSENGLSIVGGQFFYFPKVRGVDLGPPERLIICMVPGQIPDDYRNRAPQIAYNLRVHRVDVTDTDLFAPYIMLELHPWPA